MKNKKTIIIASVIAIALILGIIAGVVLYKIVMPSNDKEDVNNIFKLQKDEVAIVVDNKVQNEHAIKMDNQIYVPSDIVMDYIDERCFVDTVEGYLVYADETGVLKAKNDTKDYYFNKAKKTNSYEVLKKKGNVYYVAYEYLKKKTSCDMNLYKSPDRIVIFSDREKAYTIAQVKENARVRKGPGKKYSYFTEVAESKKVFINKDVKAENGYQSVTTMDGIKGYIDNELLGKTQEGRWNFKNTPASFAQISVGESVCMGWQQMNIETNSSYVSPSVDMSSKINVICPTVLSVVDDEGTVKSGANRDYVATAKNKGLKVFAVVKDFDKKLTLSKLLGRTSSREKLVNSLVGKAIENDFDGLNIDFETVKEKAGPGYLEFLRELTLRCHANGLIVSTDNYPLESYNKHYNVAEQARVVDYVVLMAYDEHYKGSEEAGSVSSISYVRDGLDNMLKVVPKERLICGLPFYTRLWKVKGKKISCEAYGMSGAESILKSHDTEAKWDETTGQYYAEYKSNGAIFKIWLEEETSVEKKVKEGLKRKIAGFAFWKLGFERAATWKTIDALIK